jgi:hypothetical protein
MMSKQKSLALFILLISSAILIDAQEQLGTYQIRVAPDRDDWTYELNQTAKIRRFRDSQQSANFRFAFEIFVRARSHAAATGKNRYDQRANFDN